jgi:hypothetical protein
MGKKRRRKRERRDEHEQKAMEMEMEMETWAEARAREARAREAREREARERDARVRADWAREAAVLAREREKRAQEAADRAREARWREAAEVRARRAPARARPTRRARVRKEPTVRAKVRVRETASQPTEVSVREMPAQRSVEVCSDFGWGVLLDGQVRVVVCGEGTPFGAARDFQMSVGPAARSRGLVASTRRNGDRVRVEARPGPRLGERPTRRARYRWDVWLDGEPHTIPLGPDSEFPGVRAQQLVDAALRAAKVRGLKVTTQVRDGGLTVVLHASPPGPVVRAGKYPWAEWFNGDAHRVDLTDPRWGHPRPDSFRISVQRAAKRHGVQAHMIPVVDQAVLDANPDPRAWNAAVRQSTEWVVRADRQLR